VDALDAFRLVDLLGVAPGAASGALAARRQDSFDLVGVLGLAFACGLGGGLLRDLLLNAGTPVALTDALYLPTVIAAAIVVSVIAGEPGPRVLRAVSILDALAVGFFAVASALKAKQVGVTVPAMLLIGVLGGSGGALLRDVARLLMEETGLPVIVADDPLTCVVRGCGKALENMEKLSTIFTSD